MAQASITLTMNERVNGMWAAGQQVYHLGFGESRFPVQPDVLEALRANAAQKAYPPVRGLPALRDAIAAFYQGWLNIAVSADQVIVGPGSKILLWALLQILDGDLLLPQPSWVSYAPQARMAGKGVHWFPTRRQDDYIPTVDTLHATVTALRQAGQRPGIVLFNTPNNPTGVVYPAVAVQALAEYCRDEGLVIVSDEIYGLVNHGARPHASFVQYYPEGTVVTGGLSKHLSLGGWRFGAAILPPGDASKALMKQFTVIASETWSGVAAPIQHAAVVAYSGDAAIMDYIQTCAQVHGAMACYLYTSLRRLGLDCPEPSGAFYVYPNFEMWRPGLQAVGVRTSEDLAAYLLDNYHIATLPGTAFGSPPEDLVLRLATSYVDAPTDVDAARLLAAYRRQSDSQSFIQTQCPNLVAVTQLFETIADTL